MSEVKLPKAIRQQVKAAEQLQQQMEQAAAAAPALAPIAALGDPPAPPAEAPVVPEPIAQAPAVPPVPAPQPLDAAEQEARTWRGRYEAEMPRLRDELRTRAVREEELARELQAAREQLTALTAPQASRTAPDPKDVEAFGAELIEMVRRQASGEIEATVRHHLGALLARIDNLEKHVGAVGKNVAVTAESQFYAALTAKVPDWEAINQDARWLEWLGGVDPVYGQPRQAALDAAAKALDANRSAAIFSAFKASLPPAPAPAPALQQQVAPTRAGSASPAPAPAAPLHVSAAEVHRFYDDVRRGKYRGREDEAARIEAGINRAIAEGRVA